MKCKHAKELVQAEIKTFTRRHGVYSKLVESTIYSLIGRDLTAQLLAGQNLQINLDMQFNEEPIKKIIQEYKEFEEAHKV